MARIGAKHTWPELTVRSVLHRAGFRFRLHDKLLPGKPDLILPKWKAVIFVHGCFWHGHDCHLFRLPKTRSAFWQGKIERNRERDMKVEGQLLNCGWRVFTVWECALKRKDKDQISKSMDTLAEWLKSGVQTGSLRG